MIIEGVPNRVGMIKLLIVGCGDAMTRTQELGTVIECCNRNEGLEIGDWSWVR